MKDYVVMGIVGLKDRMTNNLKNGIQHGLKDQWPDMVTSEGILTEWEGGRNEEHPKKSEREKIFLTELLPKLHYKAGVLCLMSL